MNDDVDTSFVIDIKLAPEIALERIREFGPTVNAAIDRKNARHVALASICSAQLETLKSMQLLAEAGLAGTTTGLLRRSLDAYIDAVIIKYGDETNAQRFLDWSTVKQYRHAVTAGILSKSAFDDAVAEFEETYETKWSASNWASGLSGLGNAKDKLAWITKKIGEEGTSDVIPNSESFLAKAYDLIHDRGSYFLHSGKDLAHGHVIAPWQEGDLLAEFDFRELDGSLGRATLHLSLTFIALLEELNLKREFLEKFGFA